MERERERDAQGDARKAVCATKLAVREKRRRRERMEWPSLVTVDTRGQPQIYAQLCCTGGAYFPSSPEIIGTGLSEVH